MPENNGAKCSGLQELPGLTDDDITWLSTQAGTMAGNTPPPTATGWERQTPEGKPVDSEGRARSAAITETHPCVTP
jgi:hypothetical protein